MLKVRSRIRLTLKKRRASLAKVFVSNLLFYFRR